MLVILLGDEWLFHVQSPKCCADKLRPAADYLMVALCCHSLPYVAIVSPQTSTGLGKIPEEDNEVNEDYDPEDKLVELCSIAGDNI